MAAMRLRDFYKSRRVATRVRSILFVTFVSSALYYHGLGPFRNGCDERTVTFAPEEAIFAPKASSTRVQPRRDICAEPREHLGKRVHATVAGTQFDMFVYDGRGGIKDIVSDSIAGSGSWERVETEKLMSLLPCDVDDAAGRVGTACGENARRRGTLLDVGANIGWFSMVALHLGHDVVAFEPFQSNVDLICASILQHASAAEKSRFHLNQLGLDFKPRQCELFQQKHVNIGDTHSVCDEKTRAHFLGSGYASLGWMNTTTLDDALVAGAFAGIDRIDIMKIDVEGFEPSVILGGNRFFESKYAPRYVFMEMVSSLMDSAFGAKTRGKDYLRTTLLHLANHGYELDSFSNRGGDRQGVSLQTSSFDELQSLADGKNVLFVRANVAEDA